MIADGKESIGVYFAGDKREAVVIKLLVVCFMQRMTHDRVLGPNFAKMDTKYV